MEKSPASRAVSTRDRCGTMLLLRGLGLGGCQKQVSLLARELHRRGRPVSVAVFYGGGKFHELLEQAGVPVHVLGKSGRWDLFPFAGRLLELVKRERPDVLYSFLPVPNIIGVSLKPLFPRMRIVWGVRASNMDTARYDRLFALTDLLAHRLGRFADLCISNSRAGALYAVSRGVPEKRLLVIPNGTDTGEFRPDPYGAHRLRTSWGVAPEEKLVGIVGRIEPMKDFATFFRAAARVAATDGAFRFVVVGRGAPGYESETARLAASEGVGERTIWAGERCDLAAVYSALDILCSSSCYGEGFSNVVAEAMACGCPCAVTDVGDSAAIVGGLGAVGAPRDGEGLAAAILELSKRRSAEKDLGARCRKRIEKNYSVEKMVTATEHALERGRDTAGGCGRAGGRNGKA